MLLSRDRLGLLFRKIAEWVTPTTELILIAAGALWIGRAYLNFDPQIIPAGREFLSAIQVHHLWTRAQACGWCALWDGSERGGFPAFVDPLASALHPLVIVTTLIFGVINGAKVSLVAALWVAGLAQWLLSRELKLGWLPRVWGSLMVMLGGHLSGRMELGLFSVVLSTAIVSLTFALAIRLASTGTRRAMVTMAIVLALAAVSGQGYIQAGMILMTPAYLILVIDAPAGSRLVFRRFLSAALLALLLAAPFVVPFAHFFENFVKDADPNFSAGQPLAYYLMNLFIDSPDFMYSTMLGKLPFPHLYSMFIGWIPVSLAVLCLALARTEDRRPLLFLAASAGLAIFVGSTLPLRWFQPLIPSLSALRYAPLIGGLAIPPIVGLATFTVDKLIKPNWPKLVLSTDKKTVLGGFLSMWVLLMALLISLQTGFDFSQLWLYTVRLDNNILVLLENLKTPDLQWVEPPFGEHWYIEPAVAMGLKLSPGIMTWRWKDREWPMPVLEANRGGPPPDMTEKTTADDIPIYGALAGQEYAAVAHADGSRTVCTAHGIGGDINVTCELAQPGTLIVRENSWDGWQAQMNGRQLILKPGQWLSVDLPSGEQTIEFRYHPWDVPLGILLCVAGVVLVVYCVFKKDSAVDA